MDQGPLFGEQIDVGAKFLTEFQKYVPISAAYWTKDRDSGSWSLVVASDQITDKNFDLAYGEVVRISGAIQDPQFDPFQIKVVGSDDRLAKAALELRQRYPGLSPVRRHGIVLGGIAVDEVYIYPSPFSVPTG
jgi:hypothetical protein